MLHPIIIIGAGLQGSSLALALASRGVRSTLLDAGPAPMSGASVVNEGKVHLGFVYAMDSGGQTQRLMLHGACSFAPLLDAWCEPLPWSGMVSAPFDYGVMPDSLLTADELEDNYRRLAEKLRNSELCTKHYLGHDLPTLSRRVSVQRHHPKVNGLPLTGVFETAERSVDPGQLAQRLRRALQASEYITVLPDTRVSEVQQETDHISCRVEQPQGPGALKATRVVNCAWEDRERLDRCFGLPAQSLNYRVKHQVLVRPPADAPPITPTTLVQGPYGDVVPWPDGTVYLSWYPAGRTYFGSAPPETLPPVATRRQLAHDTLRIMGDLFPALRGASILSSRAGIIVGHGQADVDAPGSGLHARDQVGIRRLGNWMSIDPGKLTTAPWFAEQAARELLGEDPGA